MARQKYICEAQVSFQSTYILQKQNKQILKCRKTVPLYTFRSMGQAKSIKITPMRIPLSTFLWSFRAGMLEIGFLQL
jgi:hypothetical protein